MYQETKENGFVWKGREIDNLKTEQLYSNSDFVLAFLYQSEMDENTNQPSDSIKKYFTEYERVLQASKLAEKLQNDKTKPFKWLINIDAKGVNSDWKKQHLRANEKRGSIVLLANPQVYPKANSKAYEVEVDNSSRKILKLRLPFDLLKLDEHFKVSNEEEK